MSNFKLNAEVIQAIQQEILIIREAVKNKQLGQYALQQLSMKEANLQKLLNQLLNKKELLTETEADRIYEQVRSEKEESLKSKLGKGYTAFILVGVVVAVGLYFAFKKK